MSEGPSDNSTGDNPADGAQQRTRDRVVVDVLAYAVARLLLAVGLTGVIYLAAHLLGVNQFPVVVAALFALIIAMPLGIWVFARCAGVPRPRLPFPASVVAPSANSCGPGCAVRR